MQKRWTVGFLIDHTDSQYQFSVLQGISDFSVLRDVNLICYEGGIIRSARYFDYERNIIYELANQGRLHGLIILSDSIAHLLDDETLLKFKNSFSPLPVIFVGRGHPDVHSVVIDSSEGMKGLVLHLVEVHGYRSFGFIKGLPGSYHAETRYQTFIETLREAGLDVDPALVFDGDFMEPSGVRAVRTMYDELKKMPEVIVACNDEMAIGALNELRRRNIDVPRDIAVVGFDDILKCASTIPPLTTVRQPLIREGWMAMETMLQLLEGKAPPKERRIGSRFVHRESCGCVETEEDLGGRKARVLAQVAADFRAAGDKQAACIDKITAILTSVSYDFGWRCERDLAERFRQGFTDALKENDSNRFLPLWRSFLDKALHLENDDRLMKGILEVLYDDTAYSGAPAELSAETLFYVAVDVLQERAMHEVQKSYNQSLKESWILNFLRDELDICLNRDQIIDILYKNLKSLGVPSFYMSLYETDCDDTDIPSTLVLAYSGNMRHPLPTNGEPYSATRVLPDRFFEGYERVSLVVESLHYANEQVGFLVFEMQARLNSVYGGLRRIVSSVFRGIDLLQETERQKSELVDSLDKLRATTAGIIKTLSITVETKDPYTAGHQRRVSDLSRTIAQKMNLPKNTTEGIRVAGSVHDIGKIYTPSEILNKPGELMSIEFELIKHHTEAGYNILKNIEFPWPVADIVLQHHERWDGSGYPRGLKKNEILLAARIICVADVVEALTSMRPYRAALGLEVALTEIRKHRGVRYDPNVVDACLSLFEEDGYAMPSLVNHTLR